MKKGNETDAMMDLSLMKLEDLEELRTYTLSDIAMIKAQIETNSTYEFLKDNENKGWLARARLACRMKGILHQRLNREISSRNKVIKNNNRDESNKESIRFERQFVHEAHVFLDPETFEIIKERALSKIDSLLEV